MRHDPPPQHPSQRLLLLVGLITLFLCFAGSGFSLGQLRPPPLVLTIQELIQHLDQRLRRQGWQPDGDALLESFDRELAGNDLTSLRSCSGTGAGYCRYDYRRGRQSLSVITVPNRNGDGVVHHWRLDGRVVPPP